MSFNDIRENKNLAEISKFTVLQTLQKCVSGIERISVKCFCKKLTCDLHLERRFKKNIENFIHFDIFAMMTCARFFKYQKQKCIFATALINV